MSFRALPPCLVTYIFTGIMEWTDTNIATAPEAPGVYILRPQDQSIGYIGMAGSGRLRARLQEHKSLNDHPLTRYFDWYEQDTEASAAATEREWIAKYDPPWNKQ